jgi:hypothetical protein
VGTCSRLATMLDADMLARHNITILRPGEPCDQVHKKKGYQVAWQLGGRYLLRYLLDAQVALFARGQ